MKHMFTLQELADDPSELLFIKDDIRVECAKIGEVTNVVVYDKEPDGVVMVRYSDKANAQTAVRKFNGRMYDNRKVEAYIADGSEKFEKSHKGDTESEAKRLEDFGKFLEGDEA